MPNRTVYLPDDLDEESRRLNLNLSHVVQNAIRQLAAQRNPEELAAAIEDASLRARALNIDWTNFSLEKERNAAHER